MGTREHGDAEMGLSPSGPAELLRIGAGLGWVAGAAWNLIVTRRMDDPYGWLASGSKVAPWRWFFREIVEPRRSFWTALLIAGETALGVLTLARGAWAKIGLAGGALFSVVLVSFGSAYTLVMAPYAFLLSWLSRREFSRTLIDYLLGRHPGHEMTYRRRY